MIDIKGIQKNVAASLAVEGAYPSDFAIKINTEYMEGKISSKEAIQKIIKYWKNKELCKGVQ